MGLTGFVAVATAAVAVPTLVAVGGARLAQRHGSGWWRLTTVRVKARCPVCSAEVHPVDVENFDEDRRVECYECGWSGWAAH